MNTITFLGTGGARFVVAKQFRYSGGIWCEFEGQYILLDPGPGSLNRCLSSRPKLNPARLNGIILTHKHLDHSNDINIMIEAMTDGGYTKKGHVFCPEDALSGDPVILHYIRSHPEKITVLTEQQEFVLGTLRFSSPKRLIHSVETYGLKFQLHNGTVSFISDTRFFPEIIPYYCADIIIINVVFFHPRTEFDHLHLADVEKIIQSIQPKTAIITHFGMSMLKAKPYDQARELTDRIGIPVIAATDGMTVNVDEILGKS